MTLIKVTDQVNPSLYKPAVGFLENSKSLKAENAAETGDSKAEVRQLCDHGAQQSIAG